MPDQFWSQFQSMPQIEMMALRRCAQYRMSYIEDIEEIGSSDINYGAVAMLRSDDWPTEAERGEIGLGFLVEEYSNDLALFPAGAYCHTPRETLNRVKRDGSFKESLPDQLYRGKHLLSREDADFFNRAKEMFA
jgi:hypothetical protein